MGPLLARFIPERKYLRNVSPRTIEWLEQSQKWLGLEQTTEPDLREFVLRMRAAGLMQSFKWSNINANCSKLTCHCDRTAT